MRSTALLPVLLLCLEPGGVCAVAETATGTRPAGVEDIVEMRDLSEPDIKTARHRKHSFAWSRDGGHVAFVTRKGNLATNRVHYELRMYSRSDLLAALRQPAGNRAAASDVLVEFSSSSTQLFEHAIRNVSWLPDSRTISFLGEDRDEVTQVYQLDTHTRRLARCTNHPRAIVSFASVSNGGPIVYVSTEVALASDDGGVALAAGTRSLSRLLSPERSVKPGVHYRLYRTARCGSETSEPLSAAIPGFLPPPLWLSPDSKSVLTRLPVHDAGRTSKWISEYSALAQESFFSQFEATAGGYFTLDETPAVNQFILFDLTTGAARPLFDAPDGFMVGGVAIDAAWSQDGSRIILGNTFLPLDVADSRERARRSASPAVAELDLRSGVLTRIRDTGSRRDRQSNALAGSYSGLTVLQDGKVQLSFTGLAETETYARSGSGWKRTDSEKVSARNRLGVVALSVRQDPNSPPEIVARLDGTTVERTVSDLNPQFRSLRFGRAETLHWRSDGQDRSGTLIYPVRYSAGHQYPLILQVYAGHDPDEFAIDGPLRISSAFPGQALAARGFVVLTLGMDDDHTSRDGLLRSQRIIETANDRLAELSLIDRSRVGLIGFSGSGVVVQQVITFSNYPIAAATIADAWAHSLFGYTAYLFGHTRPGMVFAENLIGAKPWGNELATWVDRDPSLHTDRVTAALRLEQYNVYVNPYWDIYALLRRQHKAVELAIIPDAKHQLRRPRQRLASLQGNVDWFAYWLKGEADPDPMKAEQYARWNRMRELRNASTKDVSQFSR